jgi:hypothetical protein
MGLISKFVSRVFGKKSKKSKGEDPFVVNASDLKDASDTSPDFQNQDAARNAPILFVKEEIKDSKKLLQPAEVLEEAVPSSLDQDLDKSSDISQNSISSPAVSSKKPPTCPRKVKSPTPDDASTEQGVAPDSNLDSNSLLDVPRTPRGGFLSGALTPRGLSGSMTPRGFGGSLTPRGISGALTPRGGGGHSFQRLD